MIELQSLGLKNIGVHKDTIIEDLDTQEFVTIHGLNLDSPDVKENSNGVGKSMLFGALPTMLFEADPLALSKNSKGTFLGKDGSIVMQWKAPNGHVIRVTQTKSKYKVEQDGVDMKVNIQDVAKNEWLKKYFPISRDEFYSYCYIQTQIPHPFQRATPAERLKYFTSVFSLSIYDSLRAIFKQRLNESNLAESEAKGLAGMLEISERKRKRFKVNSAIRNQLLEDNTKLQAMQDSVSDLYQQSVMLLTEAQRAKQISDIESHIAGLKIKDRNPKASLKKANKLLSKFEAYAEYIEEHEDYSSYTKEMKAAIKKLERIVGDSDLSEMLKRHTKQSRKLENLEQEYTEVGDLWDEYESYNANIAAAMKRIKDNTKTTMDAEEIEDAIADQRIIINVYENLSDHEGHDDSCPTCGSKIDMKSLARKAKKATSQLKELRSKAAHVKAQADLAKLKANCIRRPKKDAESLVKAISKLETRLEKLETEYNAVNAASKKLVKARAALSEVDRPKKVSEPEGNPEAIERKITRLEKYISLNSALASIDPVEGTHASLKKKSEALDGKIKKKKKAIIKLSESVQSQRDTIQEYDFHRDQSKILNQKLAKLAPKAERREVLEHMFKAYGSILKIQAIQGLLKQLENSLNKYSHLVFPEGMTFSLSTSAKGIDAFVTRTASGSTTDIMSLSGAETNCFRMLFAIAILPFIPEHRRVNFIVLDEPENSCSPAVRQHIIENFLPIIRAVVPNVYWITPLETESLNATNWTIVKKDGTSSLKVREK